MKRPIFQLFDLHKWQHYVGQSNIYLTYLVDGFSLPLEHQFHHGRDIGFCSLYSQNLEECLVQSGPLSLAIQRTKSVAWSLSFSQK